MYVIATSCLAKDNFLFLGFELAAADWTIIFHRFAVAITRRIVGSKYGWCIHKYLSKLGA